MDCRISELPGVMAYGATRDEAEASIEALAPRVIADRIGAGEVDRNTITFAKT